MLIGGGPIISWWWQNHSGMRTAPRRKRRLRAWSAAKINGQLRMKDENVKNETQK